MYKQNNVVKTGYPDPTYFKMSSFDSTAAF